MNTPPPNVRGRRQEKNEEETMTPKEVYEKLAKNVLPFLEAYRDDLVHHDRRAIIEKFPGVPFIHTARTSGTHLYFLLPASAYPPPGERVPYLFGEADGEHIIRQVREALEFEASTASGVFLFHLFDGKDIEPVGAARALAEATRYVDRTLREWRRQCRHTK